MAASRVGAAFARLWRIRVPGHPVRRTAPRLAGGGQYGPGRLLPTSQGPDPPDLLEFASLFFLTKGRGATDDTDQVPDASGISPPRIDQMHPVAARLSLKGKLDGRDVDLCSISSPTHPTAVRPVAGTFEIFLPANAAVPDRDFVLRWRRAARPDLSSAAWISSDQEADYALVQLRAPDEVPGNREGVDIYFLVDRSGSMEGEKWAKTAEALIAFVNAAAQRDRVWITFFESDYRDFAEKPLERDTLLRDPNFRSLAKLGTDGGTELLPALRHVLTIEQRYSTQRRSHIVLITDGQGRERGGRFAGSFRARTPRSLFRNRPCSQRGIPPSTGRVNSGEPAFF